jgi:hypothetical protein
MPPVGLLRLTLAVSRDPLNEIVGGSAVPPGRSTPGLLLRGDTAAMVVTRTMRIGWSLSAPPRQHHRRRGERGARDHRRAGEDQ